MYFFMTSVTHCLWPGTRRACPTLTPSTDTSWRQSTPPGVIMQKGAGWDKHTNNRTLGFWWRNLKITATKIEAHAYLNLVCPILKYASTVSDPHKKKNIDKFQKGTTKHSKIRLELTQRKYPVSKRCWWNSNGSPPCRTWGKRPQSPCYKRSPLAR